MTTVIRLIKDLIKYWEYFLISIKTNITEEYSNSYIGYLWWVLDPVLYMGIYVFVVQIVMGRGKPDYPIFIFSALLFWRWAVNTVNQALNSITSKKDILSHIYIPKFLFSMIRLSSNTIFFLFSILILFVMLFIYRIKLTLHIFEFIPLFFVFFLFLFGIGLWLSHIGVVYVDAEKLSNFFLRFWYYLSPGLYDLDSVPKEIRGLMWLNPLTTFFVSSRNVFLYGQSPIYTGLGIWLIISIILIISGLNKLYKNDRNYAKLF